MTRQMSLRQAALRIALSMAALGGIAVVVAVAFVIAIDAAPDSRVQPVAQQANGGDDGPRAPDFVGQVVGVWRDAFAIETPAGRRTLQMSDETTIRLPDGTPASRDDLRSGVRAAVYGAAEDLQTFRADLVFLLPAP